MKKRFFTIAFQMLFLLAFVWHSSLAQQAVPGKIEAESYSAMSGIGTETTTDVGGGLNVGWIDNNDWMDYSVNVSVAGNYTVNYRVASVVATGRIQLTASGTNYTTTVPNTTGNQTWTTVSATVTLSAGIQTIRLTALSGAFNINWFEFTTNVTPPTNVARGKTATASSVEGGNTVANAVDGNTTGTRWGSLFTDPQWITVDLGQNHTITQVILRWEAASAKAYTLQTSPDNSTWTTIKTVTAGAGGVETHNVTATGRYMRMYGTVRNTGWGYSLWEFEIYGTPATSNLPLVVVVPANQTITLPTNSIILDGSGTSDPNGDPVTYAWTKQSGPNCTLSGNTTNRLTVTAMLEGTYVFRLTATDNKSASAYKEVTVTVNPAQTTCSLIISKGKPTTASTVEEPNVATNATDNDMATRWGSAFADPQWITIDLGASYSICKVVLDWETACAKTYDLQISSDNVSFTNIYSQNNCLGGHEVLNVSGTGRYVRMYGKTRATGYGYSLFNFDVYGVTVPDNQAPTVPTNVVVTPGSTSAVVNWTASTDNIGVAGYRVYLGTTLVSTVTTNTTMLTGLTANTNYNLYVNAFDAAGNVSPNSTTVSFRTTVLDTQAPTTPTNFTADPAYYAVTLNWTASTDNVGVANYKIYNGAALMATVGGGSTSFIVSGLYTDTQYTFTMNAYDAANNASPAATVTFRTLKKDATPTDPISGIGNIAVSMPATASSFVTGSTNTAAMAFDGNAGTRWESNPTDNEWIVVDLGLKYYIGRAILKWETASGANYTIQVSDDNATWQTVYTFNQTGLPVEPRTDDLTIATGNTVSGRYVRMLGIKRNTQWAYSLWEFEIYSPGSGPGDVPNPNPNPNPAPVPPGPSTFNIASPAVGAMITNTRRPTLTWNASAGATKYEIWVNITRDDYDWYAWGNLLDRYTKLGEVTTTSYTLQQDLSDRWTYKWYIVAVGASTTYSTVGQFSIYLPTLEQVADGINIVNGCRDMNKNGAIEPFEDWHQTVSARVTDLMSRMTLEEKAYQMFYNAQQFPLSGWAMGPGTPDDMYNKQKATASTRMGIPFASAGDDIHGYGTTYPTQSTLAASRNLDIAHKCGNMQRLEQRAVGLVGVLGPLAEVGTKVLYPRIQEGCGEDADFAAAMVRAMVTGLQGGPELNPGSVMVTTKHWPGQGAGGEANVVYDAVTIKYHVRPWFANVEAGAASVMPGYAGSTYLDPGGSGAGDSKKILDYLRNVIKFDGIICTDWLPWGSWVNCANAGADVMGGADPGAAGFSMATFISQVGEARINDAVKKILTAKVKLGLFENPYGDPVNGPKTWFTPENQNLAVDAARQSITMLKNNNNLLPLNLPTGSNLLVTGSKANDGEDYCIWTSYFHKDKGAKNMFEAIKEKGNAKGINVYLDNAPNPAAAIVVLGEPTYTHGTMWDNNMPWIHDAYFRIQDYWEYDSTVLSNVKNMGIPYVLVMIMPRPYVLTNPINDATSVLIAYRPGDGGGPALSQILFGEYAPKGKLPWSLPRSMAQIGLDDPSKAYERWDLPFDLGATAAERQEIRTKIAAGEQPQPIYGDPLYQYGFGIQGFLKSAETEEQTKPFDAGVKSESDLVSIYPNPTDGDVNLWFKENGDNWNIQVIDMSGKIMMNLTVESDVQQFVLETTQLTKGFYTIKASNSSCIVVKKLIKQ